MQPIVLLFLSGAALGALTVGAAWLWHRQGEVAALARLQAERDAAERAVADQRALIAQTQADVRDAFAVVSKEALRDTRNEFLQSTDALLSPIHDALDRVRVHLADVDRAREGAQQAITTELRLLATAQEHLRSATEGLTSALRSPNVRGRWGEVQLRRIVELAGMLPHSDFSEKPSLITGDGNRQTPDLIIHLPGGGTLVIDAKVPIDSYLSASSAANEDARRASVALHARQVRDHIRSLGAKEYWKQFDSTPEFVVMFLPLEPLLAMAFEHDATLFDQAAALRVIPASPMSLLALLKTVAYGWQQEAMAANAAEVQQLGRELYERLAVLTGHLESVGSGIKSAADSYDRFVGSLEQKVLPSARRFRDLGVPATRSIESPNQLTLSLRRVRAGTPAETAGDVVQAESRFRPGRSAEPD